MESEAGSTTSSMSHRQRSRAGEGTTLFGPVTRRKRMKVSKGTERPTSTSPPASKKGKEVERSLLTYGNRSRVQMLISSPEIPGTVGTLLDLASAAQQLGALDMPPENADTIYEPVQGPEESATSSPHSRSADAPTSQSSRTTDTLQSSQTSQRPVVATECEVSEEDQRAARAELDRLLKLPRGPGENLVADKNLVMIAAGVNPAKQIMRNTIDVENMPEHKEFI